MTYLDLPVFEFPIDWTQEPNGSWDYDLQELAIGLGKEIFDPIQNHVVQGFQFSLTVRQSDVIALAEFRLALKGRANPWWLPDPQIAFRITGGVSTTQFDIRPQNAAATWSDNPCNVLIFEKTGQTSQIGVIQSIADNTTYERVTLASALGTAVDQTWKCRRLRLVRNASSTDRYEAVAEGAMRHFFQVVEIVEDYGDIVDPEFPLFLFQFSITVGGSPIYWRYTSYNENVISDGDTFTSAPVNMTGALSESTDSNQEGIGIEADFDQITPLRLLYLGRLYAQVTLELFEVSATDLDTRTLLFKGVLSSPLSLDGRRLTGEFTSWADGVESSFPNFPIQEVCPYKVYQPNTCRVDPADFEYSVTVDSISGAEVTVSGVDLTGADENLFDQGWIESGTGSDKEILLIIASTAEAGGSVTLTLTSEPLNIIATDSATLTLGCNGQQSTCIERFNNLVNRGGSRTPLRNLAIEGLPISTGGGGKGK